MRIVIACDIFKGMKTTTLVDDAKALGLKVEVGGGRVRLEGKTADVKRAFVMQGFDARREGETGWSMWAGDSLAATICRMPNASDYAYGYTVVA